MIKVKVFSAGSIGNHLTQACRRMGWDVVVVDPNPEALRRMKEEIYPKRYGAWDDSIRLFLPENAPKNNFDVIFLGTPPDVRMNVALDALKEQPRLIQLEKPLFIPMMEDEQRKLLEQFAYQAKNQNVSLVVGYEYVLGQGATAISNFFKRNNIGRISILEVAFREEWSGIFGAHPWLSGPHETYLGFWKRGGGASGEHSHAIHFWQYFATLLGLGQIAQVSSMMNMVRNEKVEYDSSCAMHVITETGFQGRIVQDVLMDPPRMSMRIQGETGFVEWARYALSGIGTVEDVVFGKKIKNGYETNEKQFIIKRPDDFFVEIQHIDNILQNKISATESPIAFETGVLAMETVTSAHISRMNNSSFVQL